MNDVMIILSNSGILDKFHCMDYTCNPKSAMMGSPVESGIISLDNKVNQPTSVSVTGYVMMDDMADVISMLKEEKSNRDFAFCTFVSKGSTYGNLAMLSFKEIGKNDIYDAENIEIEFMEVLMDEASMFASSGSDSDTVNGGLKQ